MKRVVVFAALAGTCIWGSTASATEVRFRGAFTVTSAKNCLARYVGETFNSAFRPANIGTNGNVTSLSQLNQYSGDVYELASTPLTTKKWFAVTGNGIDNIHYSFDARIYLNSMDPPVITEDTTYLNVAGKIDNMGNDPGVGGKNCVAGFRGAYFRRVETE